MNKERINEAAKDALQFGIFSLIFLLLVNAVIGVPNLLLLLLGMTLGKFILFYINKQSQFISFLPLFKIFKGGK